MDSPRRHGLSPAWSAALVGAALFGDLLLRWVPHEVAPLATWWTSVGLGVGLLARSAWRRWALLAPALALTPVVAGLGDAGSHAVRDGVTVLLQCTLGALALTGARSRSATLERSSDLVRLSLGALVVGVVSVVSFVTKTGTPGVWSYASLSVLITQSTSALVLTGLVLAGGGIRTSDALRSAQLAEVAAHTLLTGAALALVFGSTTILPLSFLPLSLLVWGALRFDVAVVAWQLAAFAWSVSLLTSSGHGPFALAFAEGSVDDVQVGTAVQGYVLCAVLLTLPIALGVRYRRRLVARIAGDEELFRRSFTESQLGMLLLRQDGDDLVLDQVNPSASRMLGATSDELCGRRLGQVLGTDERLEVLVGRLTARDGGTWRGHGGALSRPGSRLELTFARLDSQPGGQVFSLQVLDVTESQEARRRLESAHQLNDATLDTTACIIMVTDAEGRIVRVNAATEELTGYGPADLIGRPVWESRLASLDRSESEAMFMWPNRSGSAIVRERRVEARDGRTLRVLWNNNVVRDRAGLPSYAVLTGIDVTAERSSAGLANHLLSAAIATALVGVDRGGRVALFNAGAQHLLGYGAEDVVGRPFTDLLDPAELAQRTGSSDADTAFRSLVDLIGGARESRASDWTWRTRQGRAVTVSMSLSATEAEVEDRIGFLAIGRDVTEQRAGQRTLETALQKERTAVERLRALDHAKDEFVSTVSHELRTPVTSILGYTEMLRDGSVVDPQPEQAAMLDTITRNGERLIAICNDLLLLSGFESRAAVIAQDDVDVRACLSTAQESAGAMLAGRDLALTIEVPDQPLRVLGDGSQLDRAVVNLVSNAVKFTDDGGSIVLRAQALDGHVIITVRDTGLGIDEDELPHVFQRFFRATKAQELAIPGTGLGLAIVASIVEAHGGRIEVDSEIGVGTTFRIWLPEHVADARVG